HQSKPQFETRTNAAETRQRRRRGGAPRKPETSCWISAKAHHERQAVGIQNGELITARKARSEVTPGDTLSGRSSDVVTSATPRMTAMRGAHFPAQPGPIGAGTQRLHLPMERATRGGDILCHETRRRNPASPFLVFRLDPGRTFHARGDF